MYIRIKIQGFFKGNTILWRNQFDSFYCNWEINNFRDAKFSPNIKYTVKLSYYVGSTGTKKNSFTVVSLKFKKF